jgi:hypothetical protein
MQFFRWIEHGCVGKLKSALCCHTGKSLLLDDYPDITNDGLNAQARISIAQVIFQVKAGW